MVTRRELLASHADWQARKQQHEEAVNRGETCPGEYEALEDEELALGALAFGILAREQAAGLDEVDPDVTTDPIPTPIRRTPEGARP